MSTTISATEVSCQPEIMPYGRGVPSSPEPGMPVAVDAEANLASQPVGEGPFWFDSIFACGQVRAEGQDLAYLVHVIHMPEADIRRHVVTVTNSTTGQFWVHNVFVPADRYRWDSDQLQINTPEVTWIGDGQRQQITATTPWGGLDLILEAAGPVLYYGGTGSFELLGARQYQYALPDMRTKGTLTVEGRTLQVDGESWLDRQWGALPDLHANRWSWMNLSMPDGDKVAVWDIRSADGTGPEESWATVLHPDGTHELVPVTPLAQDARRFLSSSGDFVFPTEWTLTIPSRDTQLTVTATVVEQEVEGLGTSTFEGAATFSGVYRGAQVNGRTYVEQLGNWSRG